jgi:hypothetical protein
MRATARSAIQRLRPRSHHSSKGASPATCQPQVSSKSAPDQYLRPQRRLFVRRGLAIGAIHRSQRSISFRLFSIDCGVLESALSAKKENRQPIF